MSTTQRWVFGILAVIAVLALIGYYSQESEGPPPVFPPTGQEQGSQAPSTVAATAPPTGSQAVSPVASKTAKPSQPPPVADMKIAGRWSDAITGTIANLGYVDFVQQGNAVTGIIYNTSGYQVGTLTGRVQGTTLEYDYLANNGMTGSVSGELSADTMHLELDIVNHQTGYRERHTLHRNHLPHQ